MLILAAESLLRENKKIQWKILPAVGIEPEPILTSDSQLWLSTLFNYEKPRMDFTTDPPATCSEHGETHSVEKCMENTCEVPKIHTPSTKLPDYIIFPDNVTLALTVSAFTKPESYYNLDNIEAKDIEEFFEGGHLNKLQIKVTKHENWIFISIDSFQWMNIPQLEGINFFYRMVFGTQWVSCMINWRRSGLNFLVLKMWDIWMTHT